MVANTGFNTTLTLQREIHCILILIQMMAFMVWREHWNTKLKRVYQERTIFVIQMEQCDCTLNAPLMNLSSMDVLNLSIRLEAPLMRQTYAEMSQSCLKRRL